MTSMKEMYNPREIGQRWQKAWREQMEQLGLAYRKTHGYQPAEALAAAKDNPNMARHLEGETIKKQIYVSGRLLNFVVGK